ncbi:Bug family tripartite tricarboxylate transporter substrate binding protein [Falsiroseomonas sp. HC035]|uniref:Bug family tripartite tricarboxylate transporter substrate binding protein n=1 Tax=Falsiroseomonas sp. HC035 TaxID=3390999 RepID=UPI003D317628
MRHPVPRRSLLAVTIPLLAAPAMLRAQPVTREVRLVVGFSAGGSVDALARIVAQHLPSQIGRPVVVENRTGAGGFIGLQAVANAPPDGHVLAIASGFNLAVSPVLPGITMPINPDRDLTPICGVGRGAMVLCARPNAPFATMAELVAHASRPGTRLTCGHGGAGSSPHLMAARMAQQAGINLDFVAYRGGAPALLDLMAGRIDLYFALLPEALQHIRAGGMRGLAVATAAPHPTLPDLPTMTSTLPGLVGGSWWGLAGPAGLSPEWVSYWTREMQTVLETPAVKERLATSLIDRDTPDTAAYRQEIVTERRIWAEVITKAGIRVES